MVIQLLIVNLLVLFIFMTLVWRLAKSRDRIDVVDSAWGLAFMVAAWSVAVQAPGSRSVLIAALVSAWGLRLTGHLYGRSQRRGSDDPRYQAMRDKWRGNVWLRAYGVVFLLQGFLVWLISLPVVLASGHSLSGFGWLSILGVIIWLTGFIIEAVADRQLGVFVRRQKVNDTKDAVMDSGLWHYSRHPNYFGELMQWWAIGIIACQAAYGWIGLLGPLTLSVLIVFVSGIPPIERKRSSNPRYRDYMRRTSRLILLPPRKS